MSDLVISHYLVAGYLTLLAGSIWIFSHYLNGTKPIPIMAVIYYHVIVVLVALTLGDIDQIQRVNQKGYLVVIITLLYTGVIFNYIRSTRYLGLLLYAVSHLILASLLVQDGIIIYQQLFNY